jgi:GNAT superfamily N-acetyltransferase
MAGLVIRPCEERDVERAGDVNFVAFHDVALRHGMPSTVTTPGDCRSYVRHLLTSEPLGGLVAEEDGELVGMAWVHPRGAVATVGPIAVEPPAQGRGVGRALLARCLDVAGPRTPQVRLVHESYNTVALALYLRTGFRVVAPLLELELPARHAVGAMPPPPGVRVREAVASDRTRLVERDARGFGAPRGQSVDLYLRRGRALVAERATTLAGYAFGIGFRGLGYLGSAAADDPELLLALLSTLAVEMTPRFALRVLVPATDRRLVDGLLALGFRLFRACQYLVRGGGTAPPPSYVLMNGDMM